MANTIKIDEARKLPKQDRRGNNIGQILTNLTKFAIDSTLDHSLKGVNGPKKLYRIVQERLKNPPTSLSLKNCKKPEDVKLLEDMQIKEEETEGMVKLKKQNDTSAKFVRGKEGLKKEPNEGNRSSDVLEPEKNRIFIRSRL
ncbi:hypothetical protein JCGZ_00696 [Jatropha curcas]|uniref:Uncharacterized protein n=1 Tax=Jatropha curcas TaxID=180498 RepID=A0A067L4B1_JATCU|nr:uncharacterized protein LOC105632808 [Jatropha curcas]KDP38939.1 hypothetical protein JCGZ_00696 [Jatropha curcas]